MLCLVINRPWSFNKEFAAFFRSVGLDLLNFFYHHPRNNPAERKKVAVTDSIWIAFVRCSIHGLPVVGSVFLVALNLRGRYIGEHLGISGGDARTDAFALAFIQIAAKIQVSCSATVTCEREMLSLMLRSF